MCQIYRSEIYKFRNLRSINFVVKIYNCSPPNKCLQEGLPFFQRVVMSSHLFFSMHKAAGSGASKNISRFWGHGF